MYDIHSVIHVFNNALDKVLPTTQLAKMIERGEDLEPFHEPSIRASVIVHDY